MARSGHNCTGDCLTRVENMMEKLLKDPTSQNNKSFCSNCQKPGHSAGNCLTFRKCFNCNEKGHIAKNCKKTHSTQAKINSLKSFTKEYLEPEQHTLARVSFT